MMGTETIRLELPTPLYAELQSLAADGEQDLVTVIASLVETAPQRRSWLRDLAALREQIRKDGGLHMGATNI